MSNMPSTARKLNVPDGIYDVPAPWVGMIKHEGSALVASSFPVKPPKSWFENPKLRELTPMTIDGAGRVYGHIAGWRTNHIGMSAGVKPPRSKSGYAFFQTGALETGEGEMINVGQITLTGGHAPIEASVADAVAHYDNPEAAVMDVTAGEDRHGIWVAGALRPDVTDSQLRALRASSVSGDWRPINGRLELVAVCSVNCPGFPIPRARVASGVPVALVAAGTGAIVDKIIQNLANEQADKSLVASMHSLNSRIERLETILLASVTEKEQAAAKTSPAPRAARPRRRAPQATQASSTPRKTTLVRKTPSQPAKEEAAPLTAAARVSAARDRNKARALRARVGDVKSAREVESHEALVAALRSKAHGK